MNKYDEYEEDGRQVSQWDKEVGCNVTSAVNAFMEDLWLIMNNAWSGEHIGGDPTIYPRVAGFFGPNPGLLAAWRVNTKGFTTTTTATLEPFPRSCSVSFYSLLKKKKETRERAVNINLLSWQSFLYALKQAAMAKGKEAGVDFQSICFIGSWVEDIHDYSMVLEQSPSDGGSLVLYPMKEILSEDAFQAIFRKYFVDHYKELERWIIFKRNLDSFDLLEGTGLFQTKHDVFHFLRDKQVLKNEDIIIGSFFLDRVDFGPITQFTLESWTFYTYGDREKDFYSMGIYILQFLEGTRMWNELSKIFN